MEHRPLYSRILPKLGIALLCLLVGLGIVIAIPTILALRIQHEEGRASSAMTQEFPVTVDPENKRIVENEKVNTFLEAPDSPMQAAVAGTGGIFGQLFTWIATTIASAPWYQSIAAVHGRFVTITPGMRKEQVVGSFGSSLGWDKGQKQAFLTASPNALLPLKEGSFLSGIYFVDTKTTPVEAQSIVNEHFTKEILAHYSTTTAMIVPLNQALTIASLIEREAGGPDDMRLISGIIWNRLFLNMNLQIDATLQYVKASTPATVSWWPKVVPADRYRKSAYNTYLHAGLPPTPIATPSVAAVLAALNPKSTTCIYYFHDSNGRFHCSDTYAEHVALLKKYYGRGK